MTFSVGLIAAYDKNKLIGVDNKLPWKIKEEILFFKETTINNVVIMGSKTFISLGKPLPNRINLVLTSKKFNDINCFTNIEDCLNFCKNLNKKVFVIGGESVYRQFLQSNLIDYMYISEINKSYNVFGDACYFPKFDEFNWNKNPILENTYFKVNYYSKKK